MSESYAAARGEEWPKDGMDEWLGGAGGREVVEEGNGRLGKG